MKLIILAIYLLIKPGVVIKKESSIDAFLKAFAKKHEVVLTITSAYRSKEVNKRVGGKKDSKHLIPGMARDVRTRGLSLKIKKLLIKEAYKHSFIAIDEKDHIHIQRTK
jgi:hypothetical protein